MITADKLLQLKLERKPVSGIIGEFIMEQLFLSLHGKFLRDCKLFDVLRRKPEYANCKIDISKVNRNSLGFKEVLEQIDFSTICVAVDPMARFDFMCLLENSLENVVVAVFGGAKLYSSNISSDIFCDNVLSCDPDKAYLSVEQKPTNQDKRIEFQEIWNTLHEKLKGQNRKLKILMLAFAYPHPVGTIEYPPLHEFDKDKIVCCFGAEKIMDISINLPFLSSLVEVCAGKPKNRSNRKIRKKFEDGLSEVQLNKRKK
jgi:hypothetical protein